MKKIKLIVYALIMCMSFAGVAEAKSRGGSFKSGFSSQKRSAPKPAPTYTAPAPQSPAKKTAFGSFGATNPKSQSDAASVPQSKMSKDLNDTTAQSNALKTMDARNNLNGRNGVNEKASEKIGEKVTPSESGWFRSGNQNGAAPATGNMQTTASSQRFDRRNQQNSSQTWNQQNNASQGGGFMQGLMWFMVGHTVAQHFNGASQHNQPVNSQAINSQAMNNNGDTSWENENQQGVSGENNSSNANGVVAQQEQDVPAVETESFFLKLVRVVLWIALISGVIWVVRKVMSFRNRNVKRATHYSLGS